MKVEKYLVITLLFVFFLTGAVLINASPANYWDGNIHNLTSFTKSITSKINTKNFSLAPGDPVNLDAAQLAGAEYLRKMQADITEDNAGNGNPDVPDDPDDGGWDWSLTTFSHSTGASPTNIYGATVMGVYYTYLSTGDPALFTVLQDAADQIVSTGPSINRSGADMKFLLLFNDLYSAQVAPTTVYSVAAKAKYDLRISSNGGTATSFAEYLRDVRGVTQNYPNGIIGWDLGIYAVVAQMLFDVYGGTYDTDADDIAEVIWQDSYNDNPGLFDIVADAGFDSTWADRNFWWYTLGITGLIDAFDASGSHTAEIPDLVARLLASQYSGGGISGSYGANTDDEDWQSTGYTMMTLGNLDQVTYQNYINKMGYWLGATQDATGGWVYSSGDHYPEIGGECTAGLAFTSNDNADVLVDDDFTSQADVDVYNAANGTSYVWGFNAFATIQAAIDAVNGSTVTIANGTYTETLTINKPLTLTGESETGVIINIPAAGGYGILVTSGDVLMENFTLATNAANENYPIHASGTSNPPNGFTNLTLQNITISNAHRRTGFDIHGFNNVLLSYLTSQDAWGGNGLQVTGCIGVTIDNITTSGNAWGSMAIYASGPSYLNRGSDNVNIDGNTLSLGEGNLFSQDEFGLTNTNITVNGYEYMVRNLAFRPDAAGFYFYQDTQAEAVAFAIALDSTAVGSYVTLIAGGGFLIVDGLFIQPAIDAASPGEVLNVGAGTYREQLYIDKNIDLLGAGSSVCLIEAPDAVDRSTYNVTQWTGSVKTIDAVIGVNDAGTVTIDGFTIDGRDTGPENFYGVHYFSTSGSFTNCTIDNITYPAGPGVQSVVSFVGTHALGDTFSINISNNNIPTFQKGGIVLMGPGCTFTVNNNSVTGVASSTIAGNCIQLSYGASGTTLGNYVEGTAYTGTDWASTGILLFESGDVAMVDDEVYNCESGVNFSDWGWGYVNPSPVNLNFTNLNLHDNEWTLGVQLSRDNSNANITITDCDILNNGGDGIDLFGTGVDPWGGSYYTGWNNGSLTATITGCTITNSLYDGIWTADLSGNTTNTSSIDIHESAFIGNTSSAVNNTLPETINATRCYWEDPVAPTPSVKSITLKQTAYIPSPFGKEVPNADVEYTALTKLPHTNLSTGQTSIASILGPVDYSPFWTANYVGDPHSTPWTWGVDNTGTIQAGIDAASSGDIINITAGSYAEGPQIHVDKSLSIVGQGVVTIAPIANTGSSGDSRGWFLVDAGVLFDFSNVTLDGTGFDVYQAVRSYGGGTYDNIVFTNIVYPGYGGVALAVFGNDNVTINNCVFTNIGRIGALLFGAGLTNSYFTNNTYTGKGDGDWLDYAADISAGAVVSVDNCTITNCTGVASSDGSTSAGLLVTTYFGLGTTVSVTNSDLTGNTDGIAVGYDSADESVVTAHNNAISNNTNYGISTSGPLVSVNAENNYWGTYDGPLDATGTMEAVIGGTCYAVGDITNQVAEGFPGDGLGNPVGDGVNYCPWISTDLLMSPDDIVYMCTGSFDVDVSLSPTIVNMKSISIRISYPADLVFGSLILADANYANAPVFIWDNATGYDSVQVDMFVQTGFIDGVADLFTVSFNGTADICSGDLISMTRAVWKAGVSNDEIVALLPSSLTVSADCADPVVTINSPADGGFYNSTPILDIVASDNCDLDYLYYQIDAEGWIAILSSFTGNSYSNTAWQLTTLDFDNLSEAAHCIQFRVIDDLGREGLSSSWCFTKDVTAPAPPTDFVAEPGHNKVKLSWTNSASPDAIGVQIQRTPWGDYPNYDTPAPAYPAAYNSGTTQVFGGPGSSITDQVGLNNTTRDIYYYGIFAIDAAGNYSTAAPSAQARSTSYWLGDIADNTFTVGNYDGFVHVGDLAVFASTYWKNSADLGFNPEADFGPTVDGTDNGFSNSARGIPVPDDSISFTDLGIFAINYQSVDNVMKAVPLFTDKSVSGPLNLSLEPIAEGDKIICNLNLNNNADNAKIIHIAFEYSENLIFDGYENKIGETVGDYSIFAKARNTGNKIEFDMALMGQGVSISGSGTMASFIFTVADNNETSFNFIEGLVLDNNLEDLSSELLTGRMETLPTVYHLAQNYPNPFNPTTEIAYSLPKAGKVTLEIFNLLGQKVITLVDCVQESNSYSVSWNGQNESGVKVTSGVYLYRLNVNNFVQTRKMVLLK